jgi:uncharacterized membrane protein
MSITNESIFSELASYFGPVFTLIVVFSVLLIFVQMRFPLTYKQMLFIGAFTMLLTFQIYSIQSKLNETFEITHTLATTIKVIAIYLIQIALIIWAFLKDKKKAK